MQPDPLFVAAGAFCAAVAAILAFRSWSRHRASLMVPALLWALFAAGLLVQGFALHLPVENRAFQMPRALPGGAPIQPDAVVDRARRQQLLSALLTVGAGIGLALHYRRLLVRPSPEAGAVLSALDSQSVR